MMRGLRRGLLTAALGTLCACGSQPGSQANHPIGGAGGHAGVGGSQSSGAAGSGGAGGGAGGGGGSTGAGMAGAGGSGAAGTGGGAAGGSAGAAAGGASGGASGAGAAGTAGAGGPAGGASGGGGAGGRGGSSGGASGGPDCAGTFSGAQVIVAGGKQVILSSPTVPQDELELFFVEHDLTGGGAPRIMRAQRTTPDASFATPAAVAELASACDQSQERGISITPDGLRLYVDCYTGTSSFTPGPVHLARRASRTATFTVDSAAYGTVGPQIDVTTDELTAFTSSEMNTTSPPRQYSRANVTDPFAGGQAVPGLETVAIGTPFLASDGLTLFGGKDPDLVLAKRPAPGQPFGTPSVVFAGQSNTVAYRAPEVSADCRTLYFVRIDMASGMSTYSLEVAKR